MVCFYGFQRNSSAVCESFKRCFVIYRLPDDWCSTYIHETMVVQMTWVWTFSTIMAIIRACACWVLFVVTLTQSIWDIYIYICVTRPQWVNFVIVKRCLEVFSCDQAAIRTLLSVRPSVCLSVTPFSPCSPHREIFRSYRHWQKWYPCKTVKVRGQRSRSQRSKPNLAVSGS